ncbi:hypothetical protein ACRCJW_05435 [Aerococcus urinaeequi]|uniref:hypothetical protein n=1 Tax=Aerococcus urinaeequi TaxID=51665 RepID=UPI003D6BF6E6
MKVIYKGRGQGKTYDMIKLASENKGYILCSTFQQAQYIYDLSKDMGLSIHFPITYSEMSLTKGQRIDSILIDNAEDFIETAVGKKVSAISITDEEG